MLRNSPIGNSSIFAYIHKYEFVSHKDGKHGRDKEKTNQRNTFFLKACTAALTNCNNPEVSDESDAFGVYVGKKLKSITNAFQKIYAEALITNVLQCAVMGTLSDHTILTNFAWYSSNNNDQLTNTSNNTTNSNSLQQYYQSFNKLQPHYFESFKQRISLLRFL